MSNIPKLEFHNLLRFFPEMDLPVTLNGESIRVFQANNDPLPALAAQLLHASTDPEEEEFTEFVPCMRFKDTFDFYALIYWKAGLMKYEYFIATFDKEGTLISHAVIAGMKTVGESMIQSVANIDEDWIIHIVEGEMFIKSSNYKASSSKAYYMEVLPTGEIIFLLNEDGII